MTWLALLFGLLCAFGELQSGALAQKRALQRIESLVVNLNESLHRTQEELQEVKLCQNQTKKELGEVHREKESLEAALLETRDELAATKTLHQQEINKLKAAQDSCRVQVEALEDGLSLLRIKFGNLNELNEDLSEIRRDVRRLEDENLPRRLNELAIAHHKIVTETVTAEFRHNITIYKLKEELQGLKHKFAEVEVGEGDWESRIAMSRALTEVRRSVSQTEGLLGSMSTAINRLKHDVKQIKICLRNLSCDYSSSCEELYQCDPTIPTGYYNISTPQGVRRVYCEMNTSNCGDVRGGWMRVAHIDMTDPRHSCPQGLKYVNQSSKRMCTRTQYNPGCSSVTFPLHNVSYNTVCGRAHGYQYGLTEAFRGYHNFNQNLEGYYVAGLSVTHGSPRNHIWTFAAGVSNDRTTYSYQCPCGQFQGRAAPRFVGENYHCESGWNGDTSAAIQWHLDDPLWDSQGCPVGSTCCNRGGPWFSTTLTEEVSDDIEVRWCYYDQTNPEYIGVDQLEIFVH